MTTSPVPRRTPNNPQIAAALATPKPDSSDARQPEVKTRGSGRFAGGSWSLDADLREQLYQMAHAYRLSESAVVEAGLRLFFALPDEEKRKTLAGLGRRRRGPAT
jgi:hypothetical protein